MSKTPIRLVIPDAGVLISLAHGDLLDALFSFTDDVRLTVTDVVKYEATLRTDLSDANRIREFLTRNARRIKVDATGFHKLIEQAIENPAIELPNNIGEISIYGYINAIRQDEPGIPVLVLFEDEWFLKNQYARPRNTLLLSLAAFLKVLEKKVPGFSFNGAMDRIRNTRPGVNAIERDIAASDATTWKTKLRKR
ncbi:MAG: hypothetical protein EXR28_06065 [Betaproteobacteria bacterium]|nr:hypothetical protein [Betaproteobacteria bacterium]